MEALLSPGSIYPHKLKEICALRVNGMAWTVQCTLYPHSDESLKFAMNRLFPNLLTSTSDRMEAGIVVRGNNRSKGDVLSLGIQGEFYLGTEHIDTDPQGCYFSTILARSVSKQ